MKKTIIKAFILACILLATTTIGVKASVGPNTEENSSAFVILKNGDTLHSLYISEGCDADAIIYGAPGAEYDFSSNTLTLTDVEYDVLMTNQMGDDFKVELVGNNILHTMLVYGMGYGGSVIFTGSGTLYINSTNDLSGNIVMNPEGVDANIFLADSARVVIRAGEGIPAISILRSTNDADTIFGEGTDSSFFTTEASREIATKTMMKGDKQKKFCIYEKDGEYVYVLFRAIARTGDDGSYNMEYFADIYDTEDGVNAVPVNTLNTTKAYSIDGYSKVAATIYSHSFNASSVTLSLL